MKEKVLALLLWIAVLVSISMIAYGSAGLLFTPAVTNPDEQCTNLSLKDTSHCLNSYVKGVYNYTIRSESDYVGDQGSWEDVLANGGDCYDYGKFYYDRGKELGFEARQVIIPKHTFTIISDSTGYCILDQRIINCFEYQLTGEIEQ